MDRTPWTYAWLAVKSRCDGWAGPSSAVSKCDPRRGRHGAPDGHVMLSHYVCFAGTLWLLHLRVRFLYDQLSMQAWQLSNGDVSEKH